MSNEQSRSSDDTFVDCIVVFVDTVNCTFDAVSKDGYRFPRNCQYANLSIDSTGDMKPPSAGDTCVIRINSSEEYFLEKMYTQYQRPNTDPVIDLSTHPVFAKMLAGDKSWYARGGSFLSLLRGGLLKLGVSSICQIVFSKIENYVRLISRNFELLSSGIRMYSVNTDGVTTTRVSLFLSDSFDSTLRDRTSECSDFEISVKDSALTIMTGPKDSDGIRQNASILMLLQNGSLALYQNDPDTNTISARVTYTPNGCFSHEVYNSDEEIIYNKTITRGDASVDVIEKIVSGSYTLNANNVNITGDESVKINGADVYTVATNTISSEATGILVDAKVKG